MNLLLVRLGIAILAVSSVLASAWAASAMRADSAGTRIATRGTSPQPPIAPRLRSPGAPAASAAPAPQPAPTPTTAGQRQLLERGIARHAQPSTGAERAQTPLA